MNKRIIITVSAAVLGFVSLSGFVAGCSESNPSLDQNKKTADERTNYVPVNDVEGRNYNARLKLADNPATLLWCTVYPSNPNAKAATYPIVGKLTSGSKRPNPGTKVDGTKDLYYPEMPDGQSMYGTSAEYRYGFDPAGNYVEFWASLEGMCSTVPTINQKNTTELQINVTGDLTAIDKLVEVELAKCKAKNPDPSVPCPAAAKLLGV